MMRLNSFWTWTSSDTPPVPACIPFRGEVKPSLVSRGTVTTTLQSRGTAVGTLVSRGTTKPADCEEELNA